MYADLVGWAAVTASVPAELRAGTGSAGAPAGSAAPQPHPNTCTPQATILTTLTTVTMCHQQDHMQQLYVGQYAVGAIGCRTTSDHESGWPTQGTEDEVHRNFIQQLQHTAHSRQELPACCKDLHNAEWSWCCTLIHKLGLRCAMHACNDSTLWQETVARQQLLYPCMQFRYNDCRLLKGATCLSQHPVLQI